MDKWLSEAKESLSNAIEISKDGEVTLQYIYMAAPIIYSERQKINNESLIQEMIEANEHQVKEDWFHDEKSKEQYKFHFVSSYLYCFVISGKIDEFKYDQIMEYVNSKMELFEEGYGI